MITILKNITPKNLNTQKGRRGEYAPKFNSVIHYIINFISSNFLQTAKQIVNCIAPLFGSRPQTGLPIVNSLGLGTDLVQFCYTQLNKKNNTNVNTLNTKTIPIRKYYKEITKIAAIITILFIAAKLTNI